MPMHRALHSTALAVPFAAATWLDLDAVAAFDIASASAWWSTLDAA